jgi:hypothetical protein
MPVNNPARPLKVCATCRYWSYQHKGFCQRLGQGVGRFWVCVDWLEVAGPLEAVAPGAAAPLPPAS